VIETVLIVDDQADVADAIAEGLRCAGRLVVVCYDAESAQLVVETTVVGAVVSDIRLTGPFRFEGLDFLDHLARHAPNARVALVSGRVTPELEAESLRRGAAAVLQKPFAIADIERILGRNGTEATGEAVLMRVPTLDQIITSGFIQPRFQPIVRLMDEKIVGFESLACVTVESFLARPDLLFQYAERKGRTTDLELACIRATFRDGHALLRHGLLFLNIHPAVLADGKRLRKTILDQATRCKAPLDRLVLELTEQAAVRSDDSVIEAIESLRQDGIRFAFDDVGMAYSHLAVIERVRPAYLKVSQHFGSGFETDSTRLKLVRNLLSLANDFDAQLILEGIESKATADAARQIGIPLGQGYYFALPSAADQALRLASKERL
jgi:EAL domain-containing protein (putative c-di-GMP-specific phosphodiesterase class I)/ActR/RegA family two-component response regulator